MRKRQIPRVKFSAPDLSPTIQYICGRAAETLLLLARRGPEGVVAFDFPGGPAFRLSAYIKQLRDIGLEIVTLREPHDCGWHGRYVLRSTVSIEFVEWDSGEA